ncbi:hypothetical protein [Rhodobacteraceae bacterium DSL-40]|uniref:hypothetical protein n=1 Tax=Amaricoccus sp. B4 TaxID=3368557 RepID=UPI0013A6892D
MVDRLDGGFLRVLLQGPRALPEDVEKLAAFLGVIWYLLEEAAGDCETDRDAEEQRGREMEMLFDLEDRIAEKVAEIPVKTVCGALHKLEIWSRLNADVDTYEVSRCDLIVRSVQRDLERISVSQRNAARNACVACASQGL